MLFKTLLTLFALYNQGSQGLSLTTDLTDNPKPFFRADYSFYERAGGWLKLHRLPAAWADARQRCHAEGAILASPLTKQLKRAIIDFATEDKVVSVIFTGVHATYSEGDYASIEGVPLSELSAELVVDGSENFRRLERCLAMMMTLNGLMRDQNCNDVLPYICYKKAEELKLNECLTTDSEYVLNPLTGSCYKFHRRGLIWSRAHMTCAAEGAHLAIVNNAREAQALKALFATIPEKDIFSPYTSFASVGVRDANDGGSWMTIHGETLKQAGYDTWHAGEPNNMSQPMGELCGAIHRTGGFLDLPCDSVIYPFICEMPPRARTHNVF